MSLLGDCTKDCFVMVGLRNIESFREIAPTHTIDQELLIDFIIVFFVMIK